MPTELKVAPPLNARVTPALLPVLVMVRVPVEGVETPLVVICTWRTIVPPVLLPLIGVKLVMLVGFHVPLETIVVLVPPPSLVDVDLKRVKEPLPLGVPLEFTEPLPFSNNQSLPPDCRSTTTRLNVSLPVVGGGGVDALTFSVTGNVTGLLETAEDVNVTVP
jgi:hypothetical protein